MKPQSATADEAGSRNFPANTGISNSMFHEINDYKVIVKRDNGLNYIPNVISLHPLDQLFEATEWLVNEAISDWNTTHEDIKKRRKENGSSQENLDAYDKLSTRLGSRTQGYVNQLCLMEDILKFEYKRMAELIAEATDSKTTFEPEKDCAHLISRFKKIRTFRHKVVAHTAYTYPKLDRKTGEPIDNPETILRSILNLFPSGATNTMGDNFYSGFSPWKSELPVITIFTWESEIKPIFEGWKKLFIDSLKKIQPICPF